VVRLYVPFAVKVERAEDGRREKKSLHFEISRGIQEAHRTKRQ
jgi:hypothetical protein